MSKLAVVALGGNALLRGNQEGTIAQQEENTDRTLENILFLLQENYNLIITHGNGPQVGNILMRNDAGENLYGIPPMPLDICVADSQGGIGYMIERSMRNMLAKHGIKRNVLTLMTMVEVSSDDPAFKDPQKRIGKAVEFNESQRFQSEKGWQFKSEAKHPDGYRCVVASPIPLRIINREVVERNARHGTIVIAAGGGGIPVFRNASNNLSPAEAVIDKDMASALLASQVHADELYILTDVDFVFADYGKPTQRKLEFLNLADAHDWLQKGTFGEGTMAPKIRAAISFVEQGGQMAVITESTRLADMAYGTKITKEYDEGDLMR
ncbi:MAG: carbamate kinase [Breznakibacter sp.]